MQKLIQATCAIAEKDLGAACAARIATKAHARYLALCEENKGDSKALRTHTFRRIYPGIAVYEAMREDGIDEEKAVFYVREYFQQFSAKAVPHVQRLLKLPGLAKRVPKLFLNISLKSFGPDAGFEYVFPKTQGNEARFNIVRCPYYETCKRYGCTQIVRAFCDGDDAGYGHLHPDLFWERTKTIGRGADCCDFLLAYRKNQEGV